ncbi:huntingtin-interacting protein 1-like [Xenia sp. Carnegie-2017]|uniref:huntingtin-interacting protein 1-like n=1 Tax=Xenia sp. Carnegie-2017 TaxID=2897299 RepID=UPI001F036F69|nr:huntingtin-interacting protein 1-like [Xenia sp. Carnegie-2017]
MGQFSFRFLWRVVLIRVFKHLLNYFEWLKMSRFLSPRPSSMHEGQRSEKDWAEHLSKAINTSENAVKEKHLRSTIIGTWEENGSSTFWACLKKMNISANAIMSWKAMTVIFKLLREGHPKVLKESESEKVMLTEMCNYWKHSQEGSYGKLTHLFLVIILKKLAFHSKYDYIPGTIQPGNSDVIKYPTNDKNYFFELVIDIFDQLDGCLDLFDSVSKSLNPYKSNSQIQAVQCRICSFPMLIQESSAFYNLSVEMMYKLHKKLMHDMLTGHRNRFYPMFQRLKKFFFDARTLTYVTALINVPELPYDPPTFVGTEPKPVEAPKPIKQVEDEPPSPQPDERDKLIEQLIAQVKHLQELLQSERQKSKEMENALRMKISELSAELNELRESNEQLTQENHELHSRLQEDLKLLEQGKPTEEKLNKLKQMYSKLRTEHVQLLRTNADVKKSLSTVEKEKKELHEDLAKVQEEADETSKNFWKLPKWLRRHKMLEAEATIIQLKQTFEERETEMNNRLTEVTNAQRETEEQRKVDEEKFSGLEKSLSEKVSVLESQLVEMTKNRNDEEARRKLAEETIEKIKQESKDKQDELGDLLAAKTRHYDEADLKLKASLQRSSELEQTLNQNASELELKLAEIEQLKKDADREREENRKKIENLIKEHNEKLANKQNQNEMDKLENNRRLLVASIEGSIMIVEETLNEFENPKNSGTTCTAEYLVERLSGFGKSFNKTVDGYNSYLDNKNDVDSFLSSITPYTHLLSEGILLGKATSHMAPKEDAEALVEHCRNAGEKTLQLFLMMKNTDSIDSNAKKSKEEEVKESIQKILEIGNRLIPKEDENLDSIDNAVENEISSTAELVADAVSRIEEMLKNSRQADKGVKLEVNERILDSCNALMRAIRFLILKSKELQGEIVQEGKGSATAKEFYKRHHRWTEGLISAAKAVGWGAKVLVDAADKVVKEGGKFEELVVASNEIAASTAQLVAASRVKASPRSVKLSALTTASKSVAEATGKVVASAKTGSEMIEDSKTVPDYSKLSLTQTKRREMDSQVRVLELESQLEKERKKLGDLRKAHYQLAGASEGWEEDESK